MENVIVTVLLQVVVFVLMLVTSFAAYKSGEAKVENKWLRAIGYHLKKLSTDVADEASKGGYDSKTYSQREHKTLFDIFEMAGSRSQVEHYAKLYKSAEPRKEQGHADKRPTDTFNQT